MSLPRRIFTTGERRETGEGSPRRKFREEDAPAPNLQHSNIYWHFFYLGRALRDAGFSTF
ncbi:Hypothetical protein FKW44_013428 [Caligus rogercresseyi]|uniref:Uncharacterized protein n=1 Tax=Caligus rogercresseyi TaxID=217165 RepID=A0A7T8HKW5_CALRO|nr:Hypothetical protein FKW44_013428 [Caligus rogercresseyi]